MKRIYLDYAATTPTDKRVIKFMREFEASTFGNPSSTHREGQEARAKIDFARADIAKFISARPQEIIFTSGATEANNLAIQGVINSASRRNQTKPHVITTYLEHQSVYNLIRAFEKRGVIEATFVRPDRQGVIQAEQIIKAIKKNTVLVSVIFVSNEIGTILPVREIGQALQNLSAQRSTLKPVFHIDAVQAAQFYNCNVEKLQCDLLTLSAHKLYGPKGIGTLYVKTGLKMENLMLGGSQEYGRRPGTQNTAGIIGFAKALELLGPLENRQRQADKISKLRDELISSVLKIKRVELNGPTGDARVANNVSLTIFDVNQDSLMLGLDLAGIAASTGSACVSGSSEPSHVIQSLNKIGKRKAAEVRFTLGPQTTSNEIKFTAKTLQKLIKMFRS